jgi:hypothetical protein
VRHPAGAAQRVRSSDPLTSRFAWAVDPLDGAGLASTTAGAALLYTSTGFGFAVLATPLFLLFVDPSRAIQLVIIISTALSIVALPGLWRAIAPGLLLRLGLGSLAGLPLGLVAFRFADPVLVRALVGATILGFALLLGWWRHHGPRELRRPLGIGTGRIRTGLEVGTGLIAGIATVLVGMAGPPLLIYLLLRSPTADGAADPTLVLRVRLCSEPCFSRRDHRRARQNLAFSGDPDPLRLYRRPCGRPLGERVGATPLPSSPSYCSGQQGSTPSPPRSV